MITIVDYNAGNLQSVKRACDAVGIESLFTRDPESVYRAEKIIFPGVGNAATAMQTLQESGLAESIVAAFKQGIPILGICLGAQIVLERSLEGDTSCLGLIPGRTSRFEFANPALKIPHMGWNAVRVVQPHPLLQEVTDRDEFYFVHSYYPDPEEEKYVYATTEYDGEFCSALGRENLFATQFHPEKSGRLGLELLRRFARWDGAPC